MTKNTAQTLTLLIKSSTYQLILIKALHLIILAACWLNNLPSLIQIGLSIIAIANAIYQYKQPKSDFYLRYSSGNQWSIALNNQHFQSITIQTTTVITQWLVILHYEMAQRSFTQLIFKDSLSNNDYRHLIVELKTNHQPAISRS
jgi:hypothetical protein